MGRSLCGLGESYGSLKAMIKDWDFILNAKGKYDFFHIKFTIRKAHFSDHQVSNGLDRTTKAEISAEKTLIQSRIDVSLYKVGGYGDGHMWMNWGHIFGIESAKNDNIFNIGFGGDKRHYPQVLGLSSWLDNNGIYWNDEE